MKRIWCFAVMMLVAFAGRGQLSNAGLWTKEAGISIGAFNSNTDIGGQVVDIKSFKPGVGIYFAALYRQQLGLRLELSLASVTASDKRAMDYNLRQRNLDFTSTIKEVSLLGEIHPLRFPGVAGDEPVLSPYVLLGIGYFGFNPRTQLAGEWIFLQPLHTEGQGFEETGRPNYTLSAFNFPIGGGLQLNLSDRWTVRGEAIYRLLTTDYLDDVSTNYIDPNLFDKYLLPGDAAVAKTLADRRLLIPETGLPAPGSIRGSPKKDAFYSVNIKLGIRLFEPPVNRRYSTTKHHQGCFSL